MCHYLTCQANWQTSNFSDFILHYRAMTHLIHHQEKQRFLLSCEYVSMYLYHHLTHTILIVKIK